MRRWIRIVLLGFTIVGALATAVGGGQSMTSIATIPSRNILSVIGLGAADATTAHDGLVLRNTTPGVNGGTTVQVSPNFSLVGHAWHTADARDWQHRFAMALAPSTVDYPANIPPGSNVIPAATLHFYGEVVGHDSSPREIARLQQNGNWLTSSSIDAGMGYEFDPTGANQLGDLSAAPPSGIYWRKFSTDSSTGSPTSRAAMASSAPGLWQLFAWGSASSDSIEYNLGAATPSIASGFGTNPSIAATSNNTHGAITIGTGGTATTGIVNFGSPAWTNVPRCFATMNTITTSEIRAMGTAASTTQLQITAATAWTASTVLHYFCVGRAS